MKDVGFRIRVQRDLRERFLAACRKQDKPAAQVLRDFMRGYIAENTPAVAIERPDSSQMAQPKELPAHVATISRRK